VTSDDKRKQWMDIFTANTTDSDKPSVTDPSAAPTQAAAPATTEAQLQDQFGTGFINFGQYGKGAPDTQQYQPIPNSSGSLYDPTAPPQGPMGQVTPVAQRQLPGMPEQPQPAEPENVPGPVVKPFRRTRNALGYRGGEY
jgi:hypothetical protein